MTTKEAIALIEKTANEIWIPLGPSVIRDRGYAAIELDGMGITWLIVLMVGSYIGIFWWAYHEGVDQGRRDVECKINMINLHAQEDANDLARIRKAGSADRNLDLLQEAKAARSRREYPEPYGKQVNPSDRLELKPQDEERPEQVGA